MDENNQYINNVTIIRRYGPISRAWIAKEKNLSLPTIMSNVKEEINRKKSTWRRVTGG